MDEKELKERIAKVLASGDGERLTSKELGVVSDFMKSAKDAFLEADATGNEKTRARGVALATKALDMIEEGQPARPPRGQGPVSRAPGNGTLSIQEAAEMFVALGEKGLPVTKAHWKAAGFLRE